ncbi:MAG: AMP phosphorylase [Candidatus Parvarchaeota archaeon]|nr:AMP phosphorylase [Candidatus Jingweiarchaeum tengchongense]MCW1297828.1 AMP phosphorylase [Candidatus Jingweiarchaeum tengchongense]MCW1299839.1 AMP phosphorylase [Candidatus Jingweiarchaeum tengchongense]MCW1304191.1 AMP phosphorylase [Candidatus Jingweiarchaeum tengchongense]MCW1305219.1 AMP phosphorylase [Candidatus Jingweiarchaeum tengchongense]
MKLKVRNFDLTAGGKHIVILNEEFAKNIGIFPMDRAVIKKGNKSLTVVVDLASVILGEGLIGTFREVWKDLKLRDGDTIEFELAEKPSSIEAIKKKINGEELNKNEIYSIVNDIVKNNLTEIELTYFVSACYMKGMSLEETYHLTKAMIDTGERLKLKRYPIMDLHSIGGVPGNRITMIIVPIIAAYGLIIPKTSSRAITSPAGTADTMEVLANVTFDINELKKIVLKTNGCIVWGGSLNLAPADDKIIKIEHPFSLDPESQMLASILAKKMAVGSTHILIDIPIGKGGKVEDIEHARHLQRQFLRLGARLNINIQTVFTSGDEPIGNGIGPALEARDVLLVLHNRGPRDLREKSLNLAANLLEMSGKVRRGKGRKIAEQILISGKALKKMREIIKAQNGNPNVNVSDISIGKYSYDFLSDRTGKVELIDNTMISYIARILGCPRDKGAGIYLHKHIDSHVKKREKLLTLYSESEGKIDKAIDILKQINPIIIK